MPVNQLVVRAANEAARIKRETERRGERDRDRETKRQSYVLYVMCNNMCHFEIMNLKHDIVSKSKT